MHKLLALAALLVALPAGAVNIEWVLVDGPGNAADTAENCLNVSADCGSVADAYRISKFEVTNTACAEFLNAVAAADPNGLYSTAMDANQSGGIVRSGEDGSYTYAVKSGRESDPVVFVSWFDALRFANWLHNGQPTGAQGPATTEDGAYPFTGLASVGARSGGADVVLPTENEWYKAAYYDAALPGYYAYPAGADVATTCAAPGATPNTANCGSLVGTLTDVGAYTGSPSPSGTFDQGGNVYEWNETGFELVPSATTVGIRGGDSVDSADATAASSRGGNQEPTSELDFVGFRVAAVPEPGPLLLALTGALVLSAARRRA